MMSIKEIFNKKIPKANNNERDIACRWAMKMRKMVWKGMTNIPTAGLTMILLMTNFWAFNKKIKTNKALIRFKMRTKIKGMIKMMTKMDKILILLLSAFIHMAKMKFYNRDKMIKFHNKMNILDNKCKWKTIINSNHYIYQFNHGNLKPDKIQLNNKIILQVSHNLANP